MPPSYQLASAPVRLTVDKVLQKVKGFLQSYSWILEAEDIELELFKKAVDLAVGEAQQESPQRAVQPDWMMATSLDYLWRAACTCSYPS